MKHYREDAGLSQREMSTRLGLSDSYISDVEHSLRRPFTPERIDDLVHALELSRNDADQLAAAASRERLTSLTPTEMVEVVVDRLGAADARSLVEKVIAERAAR